MLSQMFGRFFGGRPTIIHAPPPPISAAPGDVVINTTKTPFTPKGYKVHFHESQGVLVMRPEDLTQMVRERAHTAFYDQLRKPPMSASILDFLLEHPELIPTDPTIRGFYFRDTLYIEKGYKGGLSYPYYVRSLFRDERGKWKADIVWGDPDWGPMGY
mgnify:CR=1 FL=1